MTSHRIPRALALAAAVAAVAACSSEGAKERAASRRASRDAAGCASLDTTVVVGQAVTQFITTTTPKPLRFLYVPGADGSTLPDAGVRALQDKGPTYLFPADTAQQAIVRKRLSDAGPWNALLVTWHGVTQPTPESARVRVGGTWIGHDNDGQTVPTRAATFECRSAGDSAHVWRFTGMAEGQGA